MSVPTLWTVGHGTATEDEFGSLVTGAGIRHLVDIRTAPGSRRHPHFSRDALSVWLPNRGVSYAWEPRLGGFRKAAADSPDVVWRNDSFRGYAGWMRTQDFRAALSEVLATATEEPTVVMCSESVWWRCHRRLVSDAALLLHDVAVTHLMHDGRHVEHQPTEGVRVDDGLLVYDAGQTAL
jgi:uncharacterized protein (DUF488 family)